MGTEVTQVLQGAEFDVTSCKIWVTIRWQDMQVLQLLNTARFMWQGRTWERQRFNKSLFSIIGQGVGFYGSPVKCFLVLATISDIRTGGSQQGGLPSLLVIVYSSYDLTYTTKQGSRVSWSARTGLAAFGKGVQLISGSLFVETEQRSRLQ